MTPDETGTETAAAAVLRDCLSAPPLLPGPGGPCTGRLLCLDGPAGSGKTWLAAAVERCAGGTVRVLHLDDLYEGWTGLAAVAERLRDRVVAPLAEHGVGRYHRWDWHTGTWAEEHPVQPVDLLVLEGVGAGTPLLDPWRTLLVWVDAPADVRSRRAHARDGPGLAPHWDGWSASEAEVFARDRTRSRADLLLDGTRAAGGGVR